MAKLKQKQIQVDKFSSSKTISLSGDATASTSWDASGALNLSTVVNKAVSADKFSSSKTITLSGAVSGSASWDASGALSIVTDLIDSIIPVGSILSFATTAISEKYLECNGQSVTTANYPKLFAVLGYTYGGSSGNFNVPNYQGMFLRGWSHGVSGENYPDEQNRTLGSIQTDALEQHNHSVDYSDVAQNSEPNKVLWTATSENVVANGSTTGNINTGTSGNETRPTNISVIYAIKAK